MVEIVSRAPVHISSLQSTSLLDFLKFRFEGFKASAASCRQFLLCPSLPWERAGM